MGLVSDDNKLPVTPVRNIISLSLEVHIYLLGYVHILDVVSIRRTCRALERASRHHAVWFSHIRREYKKHDIDEEMMDIGALSAYELEGLCLRPYKFELLLRRGAAGHLPHSVGIHSLWLPSDVEPNGDGTNIDSIDQFLVTPGGRYLLTMTYNGWLRVWDTQYKSCSGILNGPICFRKCNPRSLMDFARSASTPSAFTIVIHSGSEPASIDPANVFVILELRVIPEPTLTVVRLPSQLFKLHSRGSWNFVEPFLVFRSSRSLVHVWHWQNNKFVTIEGLGSENLDFGPLLRGNTVLCVASTMDSARILLHQVQSQEMYNSFEAAMVEPLRFITTSYPVEGQVRDITFPDQYWVPSRDPLDTKPLTLIVKTLDSSGNTKMQLISIHPIRLPSESDTVVHVMRADGSFSGDAEADFVGCNSMLNCSEELLVSVTERRIAVRAVGRRSKGQRLDAPETVLGMLPGCSTSGWALLLWKGSLMFLDGPSGVEVREWKFL